LLEQARCLPWKLIVSNRVQPWQADSLALLGYGPDDFVEFGDEYWECETLLVPSFPHDTGFVHPRAAEWLRGRMVPSGRGKPSRRLYLSRRKAPRRRLQNEMEILAGLRELGFEAVFAEELPFQEQISLFAQAEVIVAPHGAGLANLFFAPKGTRIVELFSPRYINPCFYSLSLVLNQPYACVVGRTDATGSTRDLVTMAEDFTVPPDEVFAAVRSLR
jgi:capsular polysaccharide biosynthesis protein